MFNYFKSTLSKTTSKLSESLGAIFVSEKPVKDISHETLKLLEEGLFKCDIGIHTSRYLVDKVKDHSKRLELQNKLSSSIQNAPSSLNTTLSNQNALQENGMDLKTLLRKEMIDLLNQPKKKKNTPDLFQNDIKKPVVLMLCGVNGVGKTTTVAKICHLAKKQGLNPLLIAGDIARAAAVDQLEVWAQRLHVPIAKGSNIQRVIHDVLLGRQTQDTTYVGISEPPRKNSLDLVIIDTAGRMQTKVVQMSELHSFAYAAHYIKRGAPEFKWLVLDASTGQNAIDQAKKFKEKVDLNGIILTKLDGTGKGGVIFRIAHELQLPVTYVGVGEALDDLKPFDAEMFVDAILEEVEKKDTPLEQV